MLLMGLCACAHQPTADAISAELSCGKQLRQIEAESLEFQLNSISTLFERDCDSQLLELGRKIRDQNRDKYYSLSKEIAEVVVYEGVAKDYVLDSHERIYLSVLMALTYLRMGSEKEARVELKKAYEESVADIYSSGTDQVNVLLQALIWLRLEGVSSAEPFFKKIASEKYDEHVKIFAANLLKDARSSKSTKNISVTALSEMPIINFEWFSTYSLAYRNEPKIKNCISDKGLLLDTKTWAQNVQKRDDNKQDPVLNYKRALRVPMALVYSTGVFVVGGALTYAAAQASNGEAVAVLGILTLYSTHRTFVNSLAPDMRYWNEMPQAIYVGLAKDSKKTDPCLSKYSDFKSVRLL